MQREVFSHVVHGLFNNNENCASTALHALTEHTYPRAEFEEAALMRAYHLEQIAVLAAIELYERQNTFTYILEKPVSEKPSDFFRNIYRFSTHEEPQAFFIGGLLRTELINYDTDIITSHVITVTGLHRGGKVTYVDTAPVSESKRIIRKVKLSRLNSIPYLCEDVDSQDAMDVSQALALIGEPLNSPSFRRPQDQKWIQEHYLTWKQVALGFVDGQQPLEIEMLYSPYSQ